MTAAVVEALKAELGDDVVRTPGEADLTAHTHDFMVQAEGPDAPAAVVYPRTTDEVSRALRVCNAHGRPVVAQGGMTAMTGSPVPSPGWIALSLRRMQAIEALDAAGATMTVQAGVTLQTVQEAADAADLFFALDLGGRGSCTVGGNAATNAGGNRVVRYGMMRELVLGVEAVLADGTVISSMSPFLKNNAGYDLKHLFIGSEGTLGVVTRLILRLHPKARGVSTALCAVADYDRMLALLKAVKGGLGGSLSAFEAMWPEFYRLGTVELGRQPPLPVGSGAYALIESMGADSEAEQARMETVIGQAIEDGIVEDAVIAQSGKEVKTLWDIRDSSGEFRRTLWPHIGFDVSIPTARIGEFVADCDARLRAVWPDARIVYFGHIADTNVHIGVKTGEGPLPEQEIDDVVYGCVREYRGSVSAEHGIGLLKKDYLSYTRSPEEIALMRTLKAALDPKGVLNPGKVF